MLRWKMLNLLRFLNRGDVSRGYKLIDSNVGRDGKKITLPHYLAMFLYRS